MGCGAARRWRPRVALAASPLAGLPFCRFARFTDVGYHDWAAPEKRMASRRDAVHIDAA